MRPLLAQPSRLIPSQVSLEACAVWKLNLLQQASLNLAPLPIEMLMLGYTPTATAAAALMTANPQLPGQQLLAQPSPQHLTPHHTRADAAAPAAAVAAQQCWCSSQLLAAGVLLLPVSVLSRGQAAPTRQLLVCPLHRAVQSSSQHPHTERERCGAQQTSAAAYSAASASGAGSAGRSTLTGTCGTHTHTSK